MGNTTGVGKVPAWVDRLFRDYVEDGSSSTNEPEEPTNPYGAGGSPSTNPLAPYFDNQRADAGKVKDSSLKDLETSRSLQRQEASINNELLMKYLPELNAANGLTGLGVSESMNIDALSRYQNTLSDIERNYQSGVSEVERAYGDRMSQIDTEERNEYNSNKSSEYSTALSQIGYGTYTTQEDLEAYINTLTYLDEDQKAQLWEIGMGVIKNNEQERLDKETDKTNAASKAEYDEAYTWIVAGYIDNVDDLTSYIDNFKNLTEDQKEVLKNYGMQIIEDVEKTKEENTGDTTGSGTVSDTGETVYVPFTPKEGYAPGGFNLALGAPIDDAKVLEVADGKNGGDVFVYGNGIFIKHNNTVYALTDENGSTTSKVYSDAFKYLSEGVAPETRPLSQMPNIPEKGENDGTPFSVKEQNGKTITYYDENGKATTGYLKFISKNSFSGQKQGEVVKSGNELQVRIGDDFYVITPEPPKEEPPKEEPPKEEPPKEETPSVNIGKVIENTENLANYLSEAEDGTTAAVVGDAISQAWDAFLKMLKIK